MTTGKAAALEQLERVLASRGFAQNRRQSRFLRFLVERQMEGREAELKESVIGVEVFGRQPTYNPKQDAIVRIEAGRLRARLAEYYANGGKDDPVIIELPKGGYVPVVRKVAVPLNPPVPSRRRLWTALAGIGIVAITSLALATRASWGDRRMKATGWRHYETSAAYDLYLRARAAYHPGRELPDEDVDTYREAIAKDPAFAPAYAGLAAASAFASGSPRVADRKNYLVNMRAAAQRALQLDPSLPEAYDAMGIVYARLGEWDQARKSFLRAFELDPNAPAAYLDSVMNLDLPLGEISNALQKAQLAEKADPRSRDVQDVYAYALILAGEFDQAEEHCRKSLDSVECMGRVRIGQGRIAEAIQILLAARNPRYLDYAYGRAGRREEAEKPTAFSMGADQRVLIYAGLGDKDRTIDALDRMTELGPVRVGRILTFPELAFLRGDPRVKALRKKVRLPE